MVQVMGKLAVSLILLAGSALAASDDEAAIQSTFVKPWVEALRSKDKARLERLFHPAVRACINSSTQEFFDIGIERLMDPVRSGPYRITKLAPMTGPFPAFLPEDGFHVPVQPTYDLNLQFDQSDEVMAIFSGAVEWRVVRGFSMSQRKRHGVLPPDTGRLCRGAKEGRPTCRKFERSSAKRIKRPASTGAVRSGHSENPRRHRRGYGQGDARDECAEEAVVSYFKNPAATSLPESRIEYCVSLQRVLVARTV